jgi:glycosyltransferase involved in cell wall biosynthesis
MIKLSITIPTYNRPEQLIRTLRSIFDCIIPDHVEIIILDNASPIPVEKLVCDELPHAAPCVRFIRNPSNIGLAANLMRCFEHAQGEWVWLLGDDDTLHLGAIRTILDVIATASPADVLLKFNSTNGGQVTHEDILDGLGALADRCKEFRFYSNLLFISSSVYRRQEMIERLSIGYHWCFSMAPHIAMLVDAMSVGRQVRLVPHELVCHGLAITSDSWNLTRVLSGFTSLADLERGGEFISSAMPAVAYQYLGGGLWWRKLLKAFVSQTGRTSAFWCGYFARYGAIIGGWRGFLINQTSWFMRLTLAFPGIRALAGLIFKDVDTVGNLDRS